MKKVLVFVALMLVAMASESFAASANLRWTFSTTNNDGSLADTASAVVKLYQSSTAPVTLSSALVYTSLPGAVAINGVPVTANCGITYYFAITTTAVGQTSALSTTRSASYACVAPNRPVLDSITIFK